MKNVNHMGKRFLALLIAVVMIVGQIPFGAVATQEGGEGADPTTPFENVEFQAKLTRTVVTEQSSEEPEVEGGEPTITPATYSYAVSVQTKTTGAEYANAATEDYIIDWIFSNEEYNTEDATVSTKDADVKVKISYNGRVLIVSASEEYTEWKPIIVWGYEKVTVLDVKDVTAPGATGTSGWDAAYKWIQTDGKAVDNKFTAAAEDLNNPVLVAEYRLQNEAAETIYAVQYNTTVDYADVDADSVVITAENTPNDFGWYTSLPQNVTITATADAKYSSPEMIRPVAGGTWRQAEAQNVAGKISLVNEIEVNETTKISLAGKELQMNIDTSAPEIVDVTAYEDASGNVHVAAKVTASSSGIASVKVGESDLTLNGDIYTGTFTGVDSITVVATGNNGLQSEQTVAVAPDLAFGTWSVSGETGKYHETEQKVYVAADTSVSVSVNVNTAQENVTAAGADLSGGTSTTVTYTTSSEVAANTYKASATDYRGTKETTFLKEIVVDKDAPTWAPAMNEAQKATVDAKQFYQGAELEYSLNLSDNASGVASFAGSYKINGGEPVAINAQTIIIQAGQTLSDVQITVIDNCGNSETYSDPNTYVVDNKAPELAYEIDDTYVSNIVKTDEGIYLILKDEYKYQSANSPEEITINATATLTEDNMAADAVNGWTKTGNQYTKQFAVTVTKGSTNRLKLEAPVFEDLVGFKIASTTDIRVANSSNVVKVDGTEAEVKVDRRPPSSDETENIEVPELVFCVDAGLPKSSNGNVLFGSNFEITFSVYDGGTYNSGVESVKWYINSTAGVQLTGTTEANAAGTYTAVGTVDADVENQNVVLTVEACDRAENAFIYTYNFAVDTQAPRIAFNPATVDEWNNGEVTVEVMVTDMNINSTENDLTIDMDGGDAEDYTIVPNAEMPGKYTITFRDSDITDKAHVEFKLSATSTDLCGNVPDVPSELNAFNIYQGESAVDVTVNGTAKVENLNGTYYYEADQVTITAEVDDTVEHIASATMTYKLDTEPEKTVPITETIVIPDQAVLEYLWINVTNVAGTTTSAVSGADWLFGDDTKSDVKIAVDNQAPQFSVTRNAAAQYQKDENGNDDLTRPMGTGYVQTIGGNDYFNSDLTYTITITDKFFSAVNGDIQVIVNDGEPVEVASENGEVKYTVSVDDQHPLNSIKVLAKDIVGKSAVVASDVDEVQSINANNVEDYEFIKYENGNGYIEYSGKQNIVDTENPLISAIISAVGENGEPHDVEKFFYDGEKFYAYIAPAEKSSNFVGLGGITESDNVYVTLTFTLNEQNPDEARMPMASEDADGWKLIDNTWTYTVETAVEKEKAALIEFAVPMVDRADRIPTADITLTAAGTSDKDEYPTAITLSPIAATIEDVVYGEYCARLYVDRNTPEITYDGEIELAPNVKPVATVDGKDLFNESFSFNLTIGDEDSGVKSVDWTLEGEAVGSYIAQTENKNGEVSENGKYIIPVTIIKDQVSETAEVTVKIVVTDMVDNVYTYVKTFSVDNKDPQVRVVKTNAEDAYIQTISYSNLLGENKVVDYYNNVVTYTITASDLFMKDGSLTYVIDGKENAVSLTETVDGATGVITYTGSLTVNSNETLSDITFAYSDYAVHNANRANTLITDPNNLTDFADADKKVQLSTNDVVVDMDAPEVQVTVESEDNAPVYANGVTYYQKPVTYTVKVTDEFLTDMAVEGQTQMLNLSYTKENQEKATVSLPTARDGWSHSDNTYSYSFTVAEGEVLTGIELEVYDNAGNPLKVAPTDFEIKNNVLTYVGDTIVVDGTNAEILVEKVVEGKFVQEFDGNDYYDGEVTYNFTITDDFLVNDTTTGAKVQINVTYLDGSKMETIDLLKDTTYQGLYSVEDKYNATFTMKDGQAVKNIEIVVIDNAGNVSVADNVTVDDADERTSFTTVGETIAFSGLPFIVDMTKPEATLEVKGNVTQYYTNKDGVLFVRINPAAEGNSGEFVNPADYQTVELILTVSDKNLTLEENAWPIVSNNDEGGAWSTDIRVNDDSTVTYTKSITVKTDDVGVITMDMNVFDLASNPLTIENINYKDLNNTIVEEAKHIFFSEDGKFTTKVSADRRRVSSLDDNQAPVIQITPADSTLKTTDGIDLYSGSFTIGMDVTDGAANDKNSGIDYVHWSVEDKGVNPIVVNAADNSDNVENDIHNAHFEIPVTLNGAGESNDVFVTITAVDNVGNVTKFQKQIAVDNLAPRIQVTYDNNDVRNGKYFKADRVASITITDINLNPQQYAVINTTGAASGWTYDGTVGTSTVSFTVEGEHKFDMNCTDLAGNHTADEAVQYTGEAVHEFVLDKTRPVITVTFNPSTPSGRDTAGVNYYDQEQNVTVSVRDEYFDSGVAGSVNANMGAGFNLGGFYKNGSNHSASVRYTEGNNYSFDVTVTDLAGNVSDTYNSETFSVDLTNPTIVISQGDLTNEELNIVQGELVLGFTINDAQNNLSGYTVKVTHLNNEFKETLVEGADYYVVNDVNDRTTVYVDFDSIEAIKSNDGTYNVQITATDYAGHTVSLTPSLNFSLNRFGSTFMTDDEFTANFLEPSADGVVYQNSVSNKLVIKEINPNKVWQDESKKTEGSVITIAVNGQSIILEKDVHYTVTMTEEGTGSNKWYVYTYEIDPANFLDGDELVDGNYTVLLYGIDEAGNKNTNESNEYGNIQKDGEGEYSGKITFTLDHKAPVITTYGIESGDSIDAESKQLNINLSDNTPASVKVLVNGVEVILSETMEGLTNDQLWLALNSETGEYVLNIPESNEKRTVTIITTDAAGNVSEQVIEDILITSNAFVRAINNPVIVGSFVAGLVGLIALIIFLLKKKKNKEEQPA